MFQFLRLRADHHPRPQAQAPTIRKVRGWQPRTQAIFSYARWHGHPGIGGDWIIFSLLFSGRLHVCSEFLAERVFLSNCARFFYCFLRWNLFWSPPPPPLHFSKSWPPIST
jgi:hypothetical protein